MSHIIFQGDSAKIFLGASDDASIYYDGSDLIIDTQETGSGGLVVKNGDITFEGNVGVGTAPDSTANLHVVGNILAEDGKVYADAFSSHSPLIFEQNDSEVARFTNENFLIGSTSIPNPHPAHHLVSGYDSKLYAKLSGTNLGASTVYDSAAFFHVENDVTSMLATSQINGTYTRNQCNISAVGAGVGGLYGSISKAYIRGDNTGQNGVVYGNYVHAGLFGDSTSALLTNAVGINVSAGMIPNSYNVSPINSTLNNAYGMNIQVGSAGSGSVITNGYGLMIQAMTNVTNAFGIYQNDSNASNVLKGKTVINNGTVGTEELKIDGAIEIGSASGTVSGTIEYNNGAFRGRNDSDWTMLGPKVKEISSNEEAPSAQYATMFLTESSDSTALTIVNITNGYIGQELTIVFRHNTTTIQSNTDIKLSGGADFSGTTDDTLTLIYQGNTWLEKCRSVNA